MTIRPAIDSGDTDADFSAFIAYLMVPLLSINAMRLVSLTGKPRQMREPVAQKPF